MRKPKEGDLTRPVLQLLALRGVFAWRVNSAAMRLPKSGGRVGFYRSCSITGVSDVCGVLPDGRFLAVELKRPGGGGVLRESPREFLGRVTAAGGLALVVSDVGRLAAALDAEGY